MIFPSIIELDEALRVMGSEEQSLVRDAREALRGADAAIARRYVEGALNSQSEDTRMWALAAAADALGAASLPLLLRSLYDESTNVRIAAIDAATELDPESLRPHLSHLLTDLEGPNPIQLLWLVARLNDQTSLARVRQFASSSAATESCRQLGTVVAAYLERGIDGPAQLLEDDSYCWHAALLLSCLGTPEALASLQASPRPSPKCGTYIRDAASDLDDYLQGGNHGFHFAHLVPPTRQAHDHARERAKRVARIAEELGQKE